MKYAKLRNGELIAAPNPMTFAGQKIYNPPGPLYRAAGYLPVTDTPYPEDGGYYESRWEEREGEIVRVWDPAEPPAVEEPAPAPVLSPAQLREQAYDTQPVVEWDGQLLTVTQAAQQWAYYAAEGDEEKTGELTRRIAEAKQSIRETYPEEVTV